MPRIGRVLAQNPTIRRRSVPNSFSSLCSRKTFSKNCRPENCPWQKFSTSERLQSQTKKKQEIQNRNDFPQNTFSNAINSFINFTMNHTRSVRKILFPSLPIIVKYASLELPNKISRKSLSNDFGIRSWPRTAACLLPLFSVTIFGSRPFKPTFHRGFWLQSIPGPKVHHVFYIVEDNSLFLNRKVAFKTYNLNELESLKRLPS